MSFFDRLAEKLDLDYFDKRHKTALVVLACAIILIIILWILQLNKSITNPLYGGLSLKDLQQSTTQVDQTSATDAALKAKDTDGDGLSDYDEINIYHTNPYLADSDGDGINDGQEIKNGTDPNCPTGQQCTNTTSSSSSPSSFSNQNLENALNQPGISSTTQLSTITETTTATDNTGLTAEEKSALKTILGSSNDPATFRNFLLQNGADKTYVDSLSDQDLQNAINEILK
jgi:hypothetical protein